MPHPLIVRPRDIVFDPTSRGREAALEMLFSCVTLERTRPEGKVLFSHPGREGIDYLLNPEEGCAISAVDIRAHHQYEFRVRKAAPEFCDIQEGPMAGPLAVRDRPEGAVYRVLYQHTPPERL